LAGSRQVVEIFGYGLRLVWGSIGLWSALVPLTRLANRDAKIIEVFRGDLRREGCRVRRGGMLNVVPVNLQHYGRLFRSLPRFAGRADQRFVEDLEQLHFRFSDAIDASSESIKLHQGGTARILQEKLVKHLFHQGFGLKLTEGQAAAMACYADSTLLMREFLSICLAKYSLNHFVTREVLWRAVCDLEKSIRPDTEYLPVFIKRERQPPLSSRLVNAFHPDQTMAGFYDSRKTLIESLAYQRAPTWIRNKIDEHFNRLEELSVLNFRAGLVCEIHLHSCEELCNVGSMVSNDASSPRIAQAFSIALERLWKSLLLQVNPTKAKTMDFLKS
jgi:hypothetical protein